MRYLSAIKNCKKKLFFKNMLGFSVLIVNYLIVIPAAKYNAGKNTLERALPSSFLASEANIALEGTFSITPRTDKTTAKSHRNAYMLTQFKLRF